MSRQFIFLLLIFRKSLCIFWEGTWESFQVSPLYRLTSCIDSKTHWVGQFQNSGGFDILSLEGTLQGDEILGSCELLSNTYLTINFNLLNGTTELNVIPGSAIHFIHNTMDVVYPFNLTVVTQGGEVLFEALNVLLESDIFWRTDFSLQDDYLVKLRDGIYVKWGTNIAFIYYIAIGPSLVVESSMGEIIVSCKSLDTSFQVNFNKVSETKSTLCPLSGPWIGDWAIFSNNSDGDPSFYYDNSWSVCPSPNEGLVTTFSSFSSNFHYFTKVISLGVNSIKGSISSVFDADLKGEFHFKLDSEDTLSGYYVVNSVTYIVTGNYQYSGISCSSLNYFMGVWIEREHSTSMSIYIEGQSVKGAYFGGAILLNGWIASSWFNWFLKLDVYNTITEEKSTLNLAINGEEELYDADDDLQWEDTTPFATLKTRSTNSIPNTWGTYSSDLFLPPLYLCTGDNNRVYGIIDDFPLTGSLTDLNVITGEAAQKFVWTIDGGTISAVFVDDNGVSFDSTMTKVAEVSLSQCNGFVLVSTFTGTWLISNSSYLYFCQVSDSGFEGRMDTFYFSGFYLNGYLHGTYIKVDGTSGNWTAWSDLSEKEIVLLIDDNIIMNGTKYSKISSSSECGGKTFWKNSFGLLDETHPLGGCFFVCFEKVITFNIIFAYSELFGNGTMDISSGTLMGKLNNGWIFNLSIAANKTVDAIFIDREGSSFMLNYIPCDGTKYIWTTTDSLIFTLTPTKAYPNCVPKRFEPTINLPSIPFQINGTELNLLSTRKGGIDMTFDGEMTIVSSFDHNFIFKNNLGNWEIEFELPQNTDYEYKFRDDYSEMIGKPVAITNTHAFVIYGPDVAVFQKFSKEWKQIGILEPPCSCEPLYVIKSFSADDEFCVVEVTWYDEVFNLALYNVSFGMVDFTPFYSIAIGEYWPKTPVYSVAIHPSWFVYTTLGVKAIWLHYCALSLQEGVTFGSEVKLTSPEWSFNSFDWDIGLGFSIAVNSNYLFIGYPSSQENNGAVFVYKFNNIWRLSEVLHPPESSFNQLFGRYFVAKENDLIILKAIDSSVKPLSMALFTYTLSSGKWIPKFKMVSEEWPSILSSSLSLKKRQYYTTPHYHESTLYWSMSNSGTLFITSPSLNSFSHVWYTCSNGFWGLNCSNPCPCKLNSSCTSDILGYRCLCSPNTWGYNCENKCRECNASRCDDGATGTGICLCNSSQYGPTCNLCTCVNGLCDFGPNGTGFCSCNFGWTGDSCEILQNEQLSTPAIIAISVLIPMAMIILLISFVYFCCRQNENIYDMSDLPEEIIWYFDAEKTKSESGWMEENGYMAKNVMEDKKYKKNVKSLLKKLDGELILWHEAYAIFNKTLINNFLGFRKVTASRHQDSAGLFKKKYIQNEMRDWVMEQYNLVTKGYEWNTSLELPILPVIHGTSVSVAKSICSTGFAALSSLDQGFYGKGIYATSSCLYALPYFGPKPKPAILICLATPGNVYPIIEDHQGKSSWLGKPIANGFQSHYVVTARDGSVVNEKSELFYDEFVFPAEGQLVPIYVVLVKQKALENLLEGHQKLIADC